MSYIEITPEIVDQALEVCNSRSQCLFMHNPLEIASRKCLGKSISNYFVEGYMELEKGKGKGQIVRCYTPWIAQDVMWDFLFLYNEWITRDEFNSRWEWPIRMNISKAITTKKHEERYALPDEEYIKLVESELGLNGKKKSRAS